jgi:hypothetical protein
MKLTDEIRAQCDVLKLQTGKDVVLSGELVVKDDVKVLEVTGIALKDIYQEISSLTAMSNMKVEKWDCSMGIDQPYDPAPIVPSQAIKSEAQRLSSGNQETLVITEPVIRQFLINNPEYWAPSQRLTGGIEKPSPRAWLQLAEEVELLNEQQRKINPGKAWVVPFHPMNKAVGVDIAKMLTEFAENQGLQVHYIGFPTKIRSDDHDQPSY